MKFFNELLTIELDDFINYLIDCVEFYGYLNSPMHQIYDIDKENIKRNIQIIFDKKINDYDKIELKLR